MTCAELWAWVEYRKKRGPLNPTLRIEASLARISAQINNALGGRATPADFMPWANDENDEATVNDVMKMLTGGGGG